MSLGMPFTSMHNAPPTDAQRTAVARSPLAIDLITVDRMQRALQVVSRAFAPKELDVLQFQGEPYFIASRPPAPYSYEEEIGSNDERSQSQPRPEHLIVSALEPERGTFRRFSDDSMWTIAKAAMPGIPVRDAGSPNTTRITTTSTATDRCRFFVSATTTRVRRGSIWSPAVGR